MYEKSVRIPDAWKKDEEVFEQIKKLSENNESAYQLKEAEYYGLESIKLCAVQPENAGGSRTGNTDGGTVSYFCLKFNDAKIFMNNRKDFKAEGKMQPLVQLILTLYKSIKNQIILFFDYEEEQKFKICIPELKVGASGENIYNTIYCTNWIYDDYKSEKAAITLQEINDIMAAAAEGNPEATVDKIIKAITLITMSHLHGGIELKSTRKDLDTIATIFSDMPELQERIKATCKTILCYDGWNNKHYHVEPETLWRFLMSDKSLVEYCKNRGFIYLGDLLNSLKQLVYEKPEGVEFFN